MAGGNRRTDDRLVRYVMFTDPPLARVGLSEGEAQREEIPIRVAKLPMSNVLRTEATDETQGFMKGVVSANDDRILGFTMIGSEAGEVVAAIQTAMLAELPYTKQGGVSPLSHQVCWRSLFWLFPQPTKQPTLPFGGWSRRNGICNQNVMSGRLCCRRAD
jgi:pyruvate/2-oxoglutarate dehydrogenase complex dihydrolipoamide dehydrogenase (E3) component